MTEKKQGIAEISAMEIIARALDGLEADAIVRVLEWACAYYDLDPRGRKAVNLGGEAPQDGESDFNDSAEFFAVAGPQTDVEKALVMGYWFQVHEGLVDLDSGTLNRELKNLGHRIGNITRALGNLMDQKPQLVIQTRKEGTTRQARKRYRLSAEGLKRVQNMIARAD